MEYPFHTIAANSSLRFRLNSVLLKSGTRARRMLSIRTSIRSSVKVPRYVVILCGDHYKMDYSELLEFHVASGADVTVSTIEFARSEASHLGVLEIDRNQRIVGFEEKPKDPNSMPSNPNLVLASMGIYVFNTPVLIQALLEDAGRDTSHDFGRNIIPNLIETKQVYAFHFKDMNQKESKYWRDVGTLDAYFEANMDLVSIDPQFNLYDKEWPIRTYVRSYPPAKHSLISTNEGRRRRCDQFDHFAGIHCQRQAA